MKTKVIGLFLAIVAAPGMAQTADDGTSDIFEAGWWSPIVDRIVDRLELESGERVFAVGKPGLHDVLPGLFEQAVEKSGGTWLGTLSAEGPYGTDGEPGFIESAHDATREDLLTLLGDIPVGVMLPGAIPDHAPYGVMQDLLWEGRERFRTVHFHWGGAYTIEDRTWPISSTAGAVPTGGDQEAIAYRRAILELDFDGLKASQESFERAARGDGIRVTTPAGTDIRFRIGDRPVNRQDGDASGARMETAEILIDREIEFPPGAIRVAPIETTVNGIIVFPRSTWNGEAVEGLRLVFDQGIITSMTADTNLAAVETEVAAAGAKAFREFGLGFNPLLAVPQLDPWLPAFGYGAGVVRLSLGDNTELGGSVEGDYVRWNFFMDATVSIGEEVWVKDGKLLPN